MPSPTIPACGLGVVFQQPARPATGSPTPPPEIEYSEKLKRKFRIPGVTVVAVPIIVVAAVLGWWRWQLGWAELEAHVPAQAAVVKPKLKVSSHEMKQRLIHEVMPEYPESARRARVQGTVLLDAVVSAEGAVTRVKFVSGPKALSQAAIDAVHWWRYEPYIVNGQPATIETTVAVDFRLAD
jgi:TonB family protein